MFDGKVYRSLDTYAVFEQRMDIRFDALMEQMHVLQNLILAGRGMGGAAAKQMLETGLAEAPLLWPSRVMLPELFRSRRPSIHDLVIGARPQPNGGLEVVSRSIHDLMHVLVVGVAGWGKSTWLRSLLWQLDRASEPVEVAAIDINGSEFNVLRGWGKLRWPVARTTEDARAVLAGVGAEIERRKGLFEQCPLATKLTEYNETTGQELPPWLVVVDEGTNLLNQPGIGEPLRAAVQTARQYGVYILVAGQSAKHSVIDTQIRDNFSTRLCFKTSPTSSRVVLDDRAANELRDKGRMIAQLSGSPLLELQGPVVDRGEFLAALTGGGPQHEVPLVTVQIGDDDDQAELIRQLHAEGMSGREIEQKVFGFTGGYAYRKVREALDSATATT